jgi:type II secretory pathway component GspD/PulD (secretin)
VIRSPRIDTTTIQTTIRIPDGQTAVLGSSARESKSGKEMLIVVTPHIIGLGEAKKAP